MKKSRVTEERILFARKQGNAGQPIAVACRQMGISEATYCNWKKRHGRNDWVIRIAAEREPPSRAGARYPAPAQSGESRT